MAANNNNNNFVELGSPDELTDFLNANEERGCVITFSATWCGPCKACKPKLRDEIAVKYSPSSQNVGGVPIGYVYESDLDDFLDVFVEIKAFPTFIFFRKGQEISRVEGVDLEALESMIVRETTTTMAATESLSNE